MKGTYLKVLPEVLKENANKALPTKISIKLAKLNFEVEKNMSIYKTVLEKIIDECAEKDEAGKPKITDDGVITLIEDKIPVWKEQYGALEDEEFDFETRFTEEELNELSLTAIQAAAMISLV